MIVSFNAYHQIQSDLNNFFDYINSKLNKKYFLHNDISKWTKLVHQWKIKYPVIKENHKKNASRDTLEDDCFLTFFYSSDNLDI